MTPNEQSIEQCHSKMLGMIKTCRVFDAYDLCRRLRKRYGDAVDTASDMLAEVPEIRIEPFGRGVCYR